MLRSAIRKASKLERIFSGNHPATLASERHLRQIAAVEVHRETDRLKREAAASDGGLRLNTFEQKVFSQYGEDGIIQEIFRRIGVTNQTFIEFGVGNGLENNTLNLLMQDWLGLWIEGDSSHAANIRNHFSDELSSKQLHFIEDFITPENIEELFAAAQMPEEPDLLSIDIDGNDYYVWEAINRYKPRVVVCEYNAIFPPPQRWRMARAHQMVPISSHFGASLASLTALAERKDYKLVGCSLSGANAFYVRSDVVAGHEFVDPFTAENHYQPARYHLYVPAAGHPARNGPRVAD